MDIYIIYLVFLFLSAMISRFVHKDLRKRGRSFIIIAFIATFLLYSLRASNVGRDLPGYERMYLLSANYKWFDFSYVYFEPGYIILSKLCTSLGMSFQAFLTIVNAIILIPIFFFIWRYSKNAFLSVLIYVCYIFFEFNMTGIRQAMASSIVLAAFMYLLRSRKLGIVKYILFVLLASSIHRGASIALIYVPIHYIKRIKVFSLVILLITVFSYAFRNQVASLVAELVGGEIVHANFAVYFGLHIVFLLACGVLFAIASRNNEMSLQGEQTHPPFFNDRGNADITTYETKMFYLGIAAAIFFGYDTSARAYMFFCQVIVVLLPNSLESVFHGNSRTLVIATFVIFFLTFFVTNTLIPNSFDIIPYSFFWQK